MTTNLRAGPFLFARKATAEKSDIAIVAALSDDSSVPIVQDSSGQVIDPTTLYKKFGVVILRWEVSLPAQAGAHYTFNETVFEVAADLTGDVRVAYASCNGEEDEDPDEDQQGGQARGRLALRRREGRGERQVDQQVDDAATGDASGFQDVLRLMFGHGRSALKRPQLAWSPL